MNEMFCVGSVCVHGDWDIVMEVVNDLLDGNSVVAVKRYIGDRYIATFYFTHTN